ncbi:MAG: LptF/LptG family permease, partial [Sagittula sp.]
MQRFDRYVLSQLMVLFGFFALVLVSVYWVNRAVVLFDRLINDGHSARIVLEFTALSLPAVIALVLPMASFAAAVYVTNRLSGDSELTVVKATGFSPWRLARPVLVFGLTVTLMMSVLTHVLVPQSLKQLRMREQELSSSVSARLLREGTFLHPSKGITFYIRDITPEGTLQDVLLSDRRQ